MQIQTFISINLSYLQKRNIFLSKIFMNNKGKTQTTPQMIESDSTSLISQIVKVVHQDRQNSHEKQDCKYEIEEESSTKVRQSSQILLQQTTPQKQLQSSQFQLSNSLTARIEPDPCRKEQSIQNTVFLSSEDSLELQPDEEFDILLDSEYSEEDENSMTNSDLSSSTYPSRLNFICSKYLQCFFKPPFKDQPYGITLKRHQMRDQAYLSPAQRLMLQERAGIRKKNKKLFKKIHIWDVQGTFVSRNQPRREMSRFAKILEREKNPGFPEARQVYPEGYLKEPNSILPEYEQSYYKLFGFSAAASSKPKVYLNRVITIKQFDDAQSPSMIRQSPQICQLLQMPKANPSHYLVASQRNYFQIEKNEEESQPDPAGQQKQQKNKCSDLDSGDFVIISDEDSETLQAVDDS